MCCTCKSVSQCCSILIMPLHSWHLVRILFYSLQCISIKVICSQTFKHRTLNYIEIEACPQQVSSVRAVSLTPWVYGSGQHIQSETTLLGKWDCHMQPFALCLLHHTSSKWETAFSIHKTVLMYPHSRWEVLPVCRSLVWWPSRQKSVRILPSASLSYPRRIHRPQANRDRPSVSSQQIQASHGTSPSLASPLTWNRYSCILLHLPTRGCSSHFCIVH